MSLEKQIEALTDRSVKAFHLENCLKRTMEEMAELTQNLCKIDREDVDQDELLNKITEEYCDVKITLKYVNKLLNKIHVEETMHRQLLKLQNAVILKECS